MNASLSDVEIFNRWHGSDFFELPEFKLKIRTFANKTVDFIMTRANVKVRQPEAFNGVMIQHQKTYTDEELEARRLENIERACRRARSAVHHAIRQIGADHMLTLSTRENITDIQEFDEYHTKFIRLVRTKDLKNGRLITRETPRTWAYVGVRELQERGALHMHLACVGKQELELLRACWYVALGGSVSDSGDSVKGAINVQYRQRRFSGETETHKTFSLVRYLTKYISKSFEDCDQLGQRRYKVSRDIPKPNVQKQYLPIYFSKNGEDSFIEGMKYVLSIAEFIGAHSFEPWNRGLDIYILRASLEPQL